MEEEEKEEEELSGYSFGCSVVLCVYHGSLSRARFSWEWSSFGPKPE
jgi:hypothetical protein